MTNTVWHVNASHVADARLLFPFVRRAISCHSAKTGWLHSLISTPAALYLIFNPTPKLAVNPIFGYASLEGSVIAFSGGYFLYDLIVCLYYIRTHGVPFLIHASTCCFIFFKVSMAMYETWSHSTWLIIGSLYLQAFTPFLMGVSSMFLVVSSLRLV
jgi:hypothetical protein